MAGKKRLANGSIQYVFKKAGVLSKPLYMTFYDEQEGDTYAKRLEALLDRGIVPSEFEVKTKVNNIRDLVRDYQNNAHPSPKDRAALRTVVSSVGKTSLDLINAQWVDNWIAGMKRQHKLAPATIRAKVGALARCTDWGMRKGFLTMPDHPLRSLPDGYASYTKTDAFHAGGKRVDVERDRRLEPGEYEKILQVIDQGFLPRKQRVCSLEYVPALKCLFILAVETAMRMREMFTLTVEQIDMPKRTIFLDRTKNGDKRQVPMSSVAIATIKEYLQAREIPEKHPQNLLFPWWNGVHEARDLHGVTDMLSKLFHNDRSLGIFECAGCDDLKFHDLRHEAVSRLFERTKLTDLQISKISGHKSMKMLARYANLRGSDLASALW